MPIEEPPTGLTAPCATCGADLVFHPRHPGEVCEICQARATDAAGRRVGFANVSLGGGLSGFYVDGDPPQPYESHECFIDGLACRAEEARFGGVVIRRVEGEPGG